MSNSSNIEKKQRRKKLNVYEIKIKHWEEIHDIQKKHDIQKFGWVYRAQEEAEWPLKTSLERVCERKYGEPFSKALKNGQAGELLKTEKAILREFKRRYHQYAQHIPKEDAHMEWFSIMQHHGAPTRLLDWTYSIYVAAYFALEFATTGTTCNCKNEDCDCEYSAVWAMSAEWSREMSYKKLFEDGKEPTVEDAIENMGEYHKGIACKIFEKPEKPPCALALNPFRLNERLITQQGVFVCPSNLKFSCEQNVKAMDSYDKPENMIKIVIPKKIRKEAINWLYRANINRTVLFPGLDGFAQALSINLQEYTVNLREYIKKSS